ncbi:MAG: hypothetical protein CMQ49_07715 [Gammaproteobacteria bacterium]|nr:hypothetical protein [Gammaproteobacteria bacterium]
MIHGQNRFGSFWISWRPDAYDWQSAQPLNPDSWNYARQDWSFTLQEAGANWQRKFEALEGRPYYKPITGLDYAED